MDKDIMVVITTAVDIVTITANDITRDSHITEVVNHHR